MLWQLMVLLVGPSSGQFAGGFCLDNVTQTLAGTGFAAVSHLSKSQCQAGGHRWCPLNNKTQMWGNVEYYWFSCCCAGRQGRKLLPDAGPTGWPTCKKKMDARNCTRWLWHNKWYDDYIRPATSGYNFQVSPSQVNGTPMYRGQQGQVQCRCNAADPGCQKSHAGTCLVCRTDLPCGGDQVQFGLQFFKLHTVDFLTSLMSFAAWLRQDWKDPRLSFDYQCYGGLDYFEVMGRSGDLEHSDIWVPDIELYNNEEPLWGGSIGARNAQVRSCSSGNPLRSGCGDIIWVVPGLIKALCQYKGVVQFPFDTNTCELEVAAFSLDGKWQDVIPRIADGGVSLGSSLSECEGSQYQDYKLLDVVVSRSAVFYDCCPNSPYPTLTYTVKFSRANSYYVVALVFPTVLLAILSWATFWMEPAVQERLGYGMTCVVAVFTNWIVFTNILPRCKERLVFDYIAQVSLYFVAFSLLESGIVLFIYHQDCDRWNQALLPGVCSRTIRRRVKKRHSWKGVKGRVDAAQGRMPIDFPDDDDPDDVVLRQQIYRNIFYLLDYSHNMVLDIEEVHEFGMVMTSGKFTRAKAVEFMREHDSNFDGVLDLTEFTTFCENHLVDKSSLSMFRFKQITKGFIEVHDRRRKGRQRMWHRRALICDYMCRWLIPFGYLVFWLVLTNKDLQALEETEMSKRKQAPIYMSGFLPLLICLTLYGLFVFYMFCRPGARQGAADVAEGTGSLFRFSIAGNDIRDSAVR